MFWISNPRFYPDGTPAVGLLFLRICAGSALALHGVGKIKEPFNWMGPDAGVPGILQALAALSEFGGGLALLLGFLTPLACLGIMSTMFVAALAHLTNDATPTYFVKPGDAPKTADSYESAALYFTIALAFFLTGPGVLSIDRFLFGRKKSL
ncbi:DoxX family protein [bacterium]|nr:MAG: DoxX family protein [bacterium]